MIIGILTETIFLIFPQFLRKIIGTLEQSGSLEELYFWIGVLTLFSTFAINLAFFKIFFASKTWLVLYSRLNQSYRSRIFSKNYKDILDVGTGRLITRLTDGIDSEVIFSIL